MSILAIGVPSLQYVTWQLIVLSTRYLGLSSFVLRLDKNGSILVEESTFWNAFQIILNTCVVALNAVNLYIDRIGWIQIWSPRSFIRALDRFTYLVALLFLLFSIVYQRKLMQQIFQDVLIYSEHLNDSVWKKHTRMIIIQKIGFLSFPTLFTFWLFGTNPLWDCLLMVIAVHNLFTMAAYSLLYTSMIFVLRTQLKEVNNALENFTGENISNIIHLLDQHDEVWQKCENLNSACGIANLVTSMLTLGELLFTTADLIARKFLSVDNIVWNSFLLAALYYRISLTVKTVQEGERTPLLFSMTSLQVDDAQLSEKIFAFGLSRQHVKYEFVACGCINLNMRLLFSILATTLAYGLLMQPFLNNSPK